jgi:large subunit ribosomal protein L15
VSEQDAVNQELAAEAVGLHSLKPAPGSKKDRKRVGRGHGSGHGKTSGRGHKGYNSRAGAKSRPRFEGGQNPMPFEMFRTHTQHVNLDDLEARFDDGASIGLAELKSTGLAKARNVPVKILGRGEVTKKFTVHAHKFSASAREAIEGAGGTCQVVED